MKVHSTLYKTLLLFGGYLLFSCTIHYILYPEPLPNKTNFPKTGDTILNKSAGERVIFTKSRFQGDPNEVVIQVDLSARGSIPMAHVHTEMDEVFSGLEAKTSLMANGKIHTLENGQSFIITAGTPHLPYNDSDTASRIQVSMKPIGMFDLCLTNIHRVLDQAETKQNWLSTQLQLSRYAYFCDVYHADIPIPLQQAGLFFLTPTLRALGYHAWKATTP